MNPHALLAYLLAPLFVGALVLDLLSRREGAGDAEGWVRALVGGGLAVAVLGGFTGLGARRRLASALPGDAATPWDGHVIWAVILLVGLLTAGLVRLRVRGGRGAGSRTALVLDAVLAVLAVTITVTGIRTP